MFQAIKSRVNVSLCRVSSECFTLKTIMCMFHSIVHRVNISLFRE